MPRPFTPLQAHQNELFLDSLGRTGNVRLSARAAGVAYGTMQNRRSAHADLAQRWEAAVVAVGARLHLAGGKRGPEAEPAPPPRSARSCPGEDGPRQPSARPGDGRPGHSPRNRGEELRTRGGEPVVVRTRSGRLQVRLAHPGKLTREAEQAFLHALSATANIRLSAAAAGASARAFYRRRERDPAFAREMRLALKMGWQRLEAAALARSMPQSHSNDRWRQCGEAPPVPPMSWDQIFQLLCLHDRSVNQGWEQPHRRRRRGESSEIYSLRLQAMWRVEKSLEAEREAVRRAERFEESGSWRLEDEPPPPALVPLEQVTGWSRSKGGAGRHGEAALFGGWRIEHMRARMAGG